MAEPGSTTLYAALQGARSALAAAGVASPEADAVELASFLLGVDRGEVQRRRILRDAVDEGFVERFEGLIGERAQRIPLQHLTGRAPFRGLTLAVGPGVFVPRPETECVAGWAIDAVRAALEGGVAEPRVLDLCSGSGAIALSIKDEVPQAQVHAVEKSVEAHAWSVQNRDRLGLDVEIRCEDATTSFEEFAGLVDVVVSNPPYIPTGAVPVDPEVRDHDPALALYGGSADGLAIPRLVAARAAYLLRPGGTLVMEHADSQGETLPAALTRSGNWARIEDRRDLTGRPRATIAVRG
jgi:release factor glutamine methyltransferase